MVTRTKVERFVEVDMTFRHRVDLVREIVQVMMLMTEMRKGVPSFRSAPSDNRNTIDYMANKRSELS